MGIEPTLAAWEAAVLPLNYTRSGDPNRHALALATPTVAAPARQILLRLRYLRLRPLRLLRTRSGRASLRAMGECARVIVLLLQHPGLGLAWLAADSSARTGAE